MQMAPNTTLGCKVLLHILLWSLLGAVSIRWEDDIRCLKSIKHSLDDPHDRFKSSWNFDNMTEGFLCRFVGVECWHVDSNEVLNITLTNMGLKGQFPQGIENCRRLTALSLSNNELSGLIPSNISRIFPYGTALDLSFNRFSGNIPKQISNCSFLTTLRLDNNQLTGLIPPELALLNRIKKFSVANNKLYGPVPNLSFNESSYAGNQGLCGFPLEPCINRPNFIDSFKNGFVIGYTFSVVSVITIFLSYCVPWVHRNEKDKPLWPFMLNPILNRRRNKRKHSHQTSQMLRLDLLHVASRVTSMLVKLVSRMSYTHLKEAKNDFTADNIVDI